MPYAQVLFVNGGVPLGQLLTVMLQSTPALNGWIMPIASGFLGKNFVGFATTFNPYNAKKPR
ncbi:MAG: hypothetical protein C0424_05605 [Sphingobacteriaceae bacterium]|nr:hypothetical protein [Sphingobacteriaceae bacterium]